jgi:hypothetical protein
LGFLADGWRYRVLLTVAAASVAGGVQANVQAPLTAAVVPADLFSQASASGADLRFSLDAEGDTPLAFDLERWNAVSGEVLVRPRIPLLSTSTEIYLWWGKSDATAPGPGAAYGRHAAWAGVAARYAGGDPADRTGNGRDLTAAGGSVAVATGGPHGGGVFRGNGTGTSYWAVSGFSLPLAPVSFSAWLKPSADKGTGNGILSLDGAGPHDLDYVRLTWQDNQPGNPLRANIRTISPSRNVIADQLGPAPGSWSFGHASFSTAETLAIHNGTAVASAAPSGTGDTGQRLLVGAASFTGSVTQTHQSDLADLTVRTGATTRDRAALDYAVESNPAAFWSVGTPEDLQAGAGSVVPLIQQQRLLRLAA